MLESSALAIAFAGAGRPALDIAASRDPIVWPITIGQLTNRFSGPDLAMLAPAAERWR
jgi:hypothetical protein